MKRNHTKKTDSVAPHEVEHEMELRSPSSPTACSCFPILSLFKKDRVRERQREEEQQVQIENEDRRLEETVRQQEVEIVRFHEREKRLRQKLENITEKIARKEKKTLKVIQREERLKRELQAMKDRLDLKEKREEDEVASKGLVDVEVTVNKREKRKVDGGKEQIKRERQRASEKSPERKEQCRAERRKKPRPQKETSFGPEKAAQPPASTESKAEDLTSKTPTQVQTDGATRQMAEDKPERGGRDGGEAVTVDVESQNVQPAAQSSSGRRMLQSVLSRVRSLIERLRLRFSARHVQADVEDEREDVSPRRLIPLGAPAGVLTVNLKSCRDFSKSAPLKKGSLAAVKTTVGRTVKYTVLQPFDDPTCFDEWKQFSLQIQREDVFGVEPSSLMVVELIMLDSDSTIPILAGRDTIKLKEILKTSSLSHQFNLRLGHKKVCKLDADLAFTYGSLGYGYSHQMKHAGRTMENLVEKSLFPRCPPNEERDPFRNVETPSARPRLDILPSVMLQDTQTGTECGISAGVMDCIQRRGRLLQLHQGLDECASGEDRVQFLEKLIMKQRFSTIYPC